MLRQAVLREHQPHPPPQQLAQLLALPAPLYVLIPAGNQAPLHQQAQVLMICSSGHAIHIAYTNAA